MDTKRRLSDTDTSGGIIKKLYSHPNPMFLSPQFMPAYVLRERRDLWRVVILLADNISTTAMKGVMKFQLQWRRIQEGYFVASTHDLNTADSRERRSLPTLDTLHERRRYKIRRLQNPRCTKIKRESECHANIYFPRKYTGEPWNTWQLDRRGLGRGTIIVGKSKRVPFQSR